MSFVLAELTTPDGEEGKYYVRSKTEIQSRLDPDACDLFCRHYGVTEHGNWDGHNILNRSHSPRLQDPDTEARLPAARAILLDARRTLIPPGFDGKVLADWNGLMIQAMAEAAWLFSRHDWATSAETAMASLHRIHWTGDRLFHASKAGLARHEATSDDYANLIAACPALHLLTGHAKHITAAIALTKALFASHRVDELPIRTRMRGDNQDERAHPVCRATTAPSTTMRHPTSMAS